jgi:excisionase family DNA binding protein
MSTPQGSIDELRAGPAAITVPHAGRYLGMGRSASYEAARTGVIPTIRVGARKRLVPAAELAKLLGAAAGDAT